MSPSTIASWPWASDRPLAWIQEAVGGDFHCCSQVVSASRCNAFNLHHTSLGAQVHCTETARTGANPANMSVRSHPTTIHIPQTIDSPTYSGTCTLPLFPESTRSDNC
ncbi:hypothetical protein CDV31_007461 [Fusarium ambrosium]|uniref:Uncharacterized protein n=1 Tax=Fusarium ambrosium TaxID=131363 RepID=A0A428U6V8_9HYPO|nr:hypothetical protein CDV31_007461 [Fusarium ambrosium]